MGRYLINIDCPPMSYDDVEKGQALWDETLKEYKDVKEPHEYGNLSEGHFVCIIEAPNVDRIHQFFNSFDQKIRASGLFMDMPEGEPTFEIWPIEVEWENGKLIHKPELAKAA